MESGKSPEQNSPTTIIEDNSESISLKHYDVGRNPLSSLQPNTISVNNYTSQISNINKLKGFKIANLNVNSLLKHIDEIRHILSISQIDFLAINESKIDDFVSDNEIQISGYNFVRKDRNRFGGGVVVYIREQYSYLERNDLIAGCLEMICVEISEPYGKSFIVSACYRPPHSNPDQFDLFERFLSKCDNENKEFLIIGDINCDWSATQHDSSTKRLIFLSTLYNLHQLIAEPTRVTKTSSTLIDLILTNQPEHISCSGVIDLGLSDHSLIYAIRKHLTPRSKQTRKEVHNYKRFNERDFIDDLSNVPWFIISQFIDPNDCWRVWHSLFCEVLDRHAPL